jgi:hypothetical protein
VSSSTVAGLVSLIGLLAVLAAGCAAEPPRSPGATPDQPPAGPVFERTIQTPRGFWEFQFGGGYSSGQPGQGGQYQGGGFSER